MISSRHFSFLFQVSALALSIAALTACGGGGGGGDSGDSADDTAGSSEWNEMKWDEGRWE